MKELISNEAIRVIGGACHCMGNSWIGGAVQEVMLRVFPVSTDSECRSRCCDVAVNAKGYQWGTNVGKFTVLC